MIGEDVRKENRWRKHWMDSNALKRTAVEVLQYDPRFSDVKNELYPIVSRSTVNCVPQFGFATRS